MSTDVKQRSFWSTTSGVVTGVAGTVTGIVALLGIAGQAGWIGGDGGSSDKPASVQTQGSTTPSNNSSPAAGGSSGSGSSGSATATPKFTVDPTRLTFDTLNKKGTIKVVNTGDAAMTVSSPKIEGASPTQFSATAPTCTRAKLDPGRTCEVEVTFAPNKGGTYNATLVIEVPGARSQEVTLSGTAIL